MHWGMKGGLIFFGGLVLVMISGNPRTITAMLGSLMVVVGILVLLIYRFTDFLLSPEERERIAHNREIQNHYFHAGKGWEQGRQAGRRKGFFD